MGDVRAAHTKTMKALQNTNDAILMNWAFAIVIVNMIPVVCALASATNVPGCTTL